MIVDIASGILSLNRSVLAQLARDGQSRSVVAVGQSLIANRADPVLDKVAE
jgi:hypothetical protein